MKTIASNLFDELNRKYWQGRKPRYRVICREILRDDCLGICDDKTKTILLKKSLQEDELRLTLLHEMCHIGGPGGGNQHGPAFIRKLQRLVRLGETKLLVEDIERYDGTAEERDIEDKKAAGVFVEESSFRDVIISDLEAAVDNPWISRRRWPTIRRWLATQYQMSEARLTRICPWAEGEWKKLSKEKREAERNRHLVEEARTGSQQAILRYHKLQQT